LGRYAVPAVPRQCPNGFVIYKETFARGELAKLKPIVIGAAYQALAKKHANNFLAAYLMERMGATKEELRSRYLRASWEIEGQWPPPDGDEAIPISDEALLKTYREAAVKSFDAGFANGGSMRGERIRAIIQTAELERLLGRFDQVARRLSNVSPGTTIDAQMIAQIMKYAAMKDRAPHEFEEETLGQTEVENPLDAPEPDSR
jgi:hypothetical protein